MSNPRPWERWYYKDWLIDQAVGRASAATRGIWIEALAVMMEAESDTITGTPTELARILRATETEIDTALDEIERLEIADVSRNGHGAVTLLSRRRHALLAERENDRSRQRRARSRRDDTPDDTPPVTPTSRACHKDVTPVSASRACADSDSSSDSPRDNKHSTEGGCGGENKSEPSKPTKAQLLEEFETRFWPQLPAGHKLGKGKAREAWLKARQRADLQTILDGLDGYHAYEQQRYRRDPDDFSPLHPATWLNQSRWEDQVETANPDDPAQRDYSDWDR